MKMDTSVNEIGRSLVQLDMQARASMFSNSGATAGIAATNISGHTVKATIYHSGRSGTGTRGFVTKWSLDGKVIAYSRLRHVLAAA